MLIFGLTAEEVAQRRAAGIDATETIAATPLLADVLNAVETGVFSPDDRRRYRELVDGIRHRDWFMVAADFDAYWTTQRAAGRLWLDRAEWTRKAVLNTARVGWFSADRAILDTHRRAHPEDLPGLVADLGPDVVSIDSPPGWATSGRSRLTERELRWFGIQCFNTPSDTRMAEHPFFEWMTVGFEAFRAVVVPGRPMDVGTVSR